VEAVFLDISKLKLLFRNSIRPDRSCIGADFDAELTEQERRHSASGDASDRLSAGRTAAAPVIPEAVFFLECIVRMSRTVGEGDLSVIPGAQVQVADEQ